MSNFNPKALGKTNFNITIQDCIDAMHAINNNPKDCSISSEALKLDIPRRRFSTFLNNIFGKENVVKARKGEWKPEKAIIDYSNNNNQVSKPKSKPKVKAKIESKPTNTVKETSQEEKQKALLAKKQTNKTKVTKIENPHITENIDLDFYITSEEATIITGNNTYNVPNTHNYYPKVVNACISKDYEQVLDILYAEGYIKKVTQGRIEISGLEVTVDGKPIPKEYLTLIEREFNKNTSEFNNLLNFFSRCFSAKVSNNLSLQMFEFLKHNDICIDENGTIHAWKYLSKEGDTFVDSYSKTIKQNVGDVISMDRDKVNSNPEITCSTGLHVGGWNYVKNNTYIAKVTINPEDVVSVPVDYDGMKLRCCKYTIVDIKKSPLSPEAFN